jgi:DNA excision repair protein ERCC-2
MWMEANVGALLCSHLQGLTDGAGAGSAAGVGSATAQPRGGEVLPGAPVLPADILQEAIPGNIRNAELFVRFMKHVVRYLRSKIKVVSVVSETPARFLHDMATSLSIDVKPLKFAYSRLNSLLRTLQVSVTPRFSVKFVTV